MASTKEATELETEKEVEEETKDEKKPKEKKKLSTAAKVGIGLLVVLVIGVIIFLAVWFSQPHFGGNATSGSGSGNGNFGVIGYGFTGGNSADVRCPENEAPPLVKDPIDINLEAGGDFIFLCTQTGEQNLYYGRPAVVDGVEAFTVVKNSVACPAGYTKNETDLNHGTDSDVSIFACAKTGSGEFLARIYVAAGQTKNDAGCQPGDTRIDQDLNEGAGGWFVYFCTASQ